MRPRPLLLAALALAPLPLGAAGCRPAADDGAVEIVFWGMGREGEVVGELVPAFEAEHPGIRVRVQQIPWTAAHEKLLTAFVGDATPDVCQLGNTWVPEFTMLGALMDLTPWVARSQAIDRADYFGGIWDTNVIDGRLYGVPWYVDTRLLFYRKSALAAAGFDAPPRTWAEWTAAMRGIKEDVGEDRYAIFLPFNEWAPPVVLGMQAGSPLVGPDGRGAFGDRAFREAFRYYIGLYKQGLAPPVSNVQVANLYQEFDRGYFSMYISGPWNIGEFKARLPAHLQDDWMTAPLPGPDSTYPGVSTAGGSSLAVFRATEHPEGVWAFVEFLSRPEQQARFYELTGSLPAREAAWERSGLADDPHARAFREQLRHVRPTPLVPEWEQITSRVLVHVEAAARGAVTEDEARAALDADVDRILEKRRWLLDRAAERRAGRDLTGEAHR